VAIFQTIHEHLEDSKNRILLLVAVDAAAELKSSLPHHWVTV
jgi:hypothetical protein